MRHSFPHQLDMDTVRRAVERALDEYTRRFQEYLPRVDWIDARSARVSFTVLGRTVEGLFELSPADVTVEMKVPMLLRPFQRQAVKVVGREIEQWIERARRGELDGQGD